MEKDTKHLVKAGHQSAGDAFEFVMSTESKDRMGDIIRQDGWDLRGFKRNPIALFAHRHGDPIGSWEDVRVEGRKLIGRLKFATEGTSEHIDTLRKLVEQRILRAVSVGLSVLEYEPLDKNEPWGGWNILKSELLETSLVSVPANPGAVATAKQCGATDETLEMIFGRVNAGPEPRRAVPGDNRQKSELLGEPSEILRVRRNLERSGML